MDIKLCQLVLAFFLVDSKFIKVFILSELKMDVFCDIFYIFNCILHYVFYFLINFYYLFYSSIIINFTDIYINLLHEKSSKKHEC